MLRRSYNFMMRHAGHPNAGLWLAIVAFCEGVFFPIPPDVMLMPVVLARREGWFKFAAICTVASILGGATGYTIGYFLQPLGKALLALTGNAGALQEFQDFYSQWGVLLLALPIPYKLMAIASGVAHFNLALFAGASLAIRGARFFLVAWLAHTYGPPIQGFVEKRLGLVVSLVAVALVGLVMLLKMVL